VFVLSLIMNALILWPRHGTAGKEVREKVIDDVIRSSDKYVKKYGMRRMSLSEIKELSGHTKDRSGGKGNHK